MVFDSKYFLSCICRFCLFRFGWAGGFVGGLLSWGGSVVYVFFFFRRGIIGLVRVGFFFGSSRGVGWSFVCWRFIG